ncbi:DinB family protein [Pseudonocardia xishanensis]|uniref:DinB family protein n=1 Tax=Pseudonocardia xishanensis TaxID=630995 RepID=A0ABP8RY00_9PSEU
MMRTLTTELVEQLTFHWEGLVRPKLAGLTDEEYLWEPAPGWSIRPAGSPEASPFGTGDFRIDFAFPEPDPPPVTTIAWRMAHVIVGVLGARTASHFGGPPSSYESHEYAGTAAAGLAQLEDAYAGWIEGVAGLDDEALARPVGPAEGPYAEYPMTTLVLHIHREVIHHCAEMLLLRDLHRNSNESRRVM